MKRKLAIVLLALGTIGGFASGFRSMRCHAQWRRESFENHVAQVCVEAARKANAVNTVNTAEQPVAPKAE